jgi:hypothetical protein
MLQVLCYGETARLRQDFAGKTVRENAGRTDACTERGLSVVRRVTDHYGFSGGHIELSQRDTDKPRIRLAMFDIVAARHGMDQVVDVQQREIILQFRTLAVSRKGDPPPVLDQGIEHVAHVSKRLYFFQVFRLVDFSLVLQHLLALILTQVRSDQLECLFTVQARIKLQKFVRYREPVAG